MQNAFLSFVHAAFGDDHDLLAQVQLSRAQAIDKVQQTIDRPTADIVLSDEPGE